MAIASFERPKSDFLSLIGRFAQMRFSFRNLNKGMSSFFLAPIMKANMNKPSKRQAQRIAAALRKGKKKVITLDSLSRLVGLYPDVLGEQLIYFSPMILMDPSINCKELLPQIEEYVKSFEPAKKEKTPASPTVKKKDVSEYKGVNDFVYKKMTSAGGLVDRSSRLSEKDLKILHRLVNAELKAYRDQAKKNKAKN